MWRTPSFRFGTKKAAGLLQGLGTKEQLQAALKKLKPVKTKQEVDELWTSMKEDLVL